MQGGCAALEKEITEEGENPGGAKRDGRAAQERKKGAGGAPRPRIGGLEKEIHTGRGEVQGSLGDIPDQIVASEAAMAALAPRPVAWTLIGAPPPWARKIFAAMAERSDIQLQGLADEIALHFSGILPGSPGIAIGALDSEGIAVEDAGGAVAMGPSARRGLVPFTWRLAAMALRSGKKPGVLLLVVLSTPWTTGARKRP